MENLSLTQKYALLAFNSLDSLHMTSIKKITIRLAAASSVIELYLNCTLMPYKNQLVLSKNYKDLDGMTMYQEELLKVFFKTEERIAGSFTSWILRATRLSSKILKKLEREIADTLRSNHNLEEVPSLLACDLFYHSDSVSLKEYKSNPDAYSNLITALRMDFLENGILNDELIALIWLLRESLCIHEVFSAIELETVYQRIESHLDKDGYLKELYHLHLKNPIDIAIKEFFHKRHLAMRTRLGTGVAYSFPFLDRSQSIFIDTEAYFSGSKQRLEDVLKRLLEQKHDVVVVRAGEVPLLKIDNTLYEAVPDALGGEVPIHGVRLRRYLM